MRMDILTHVAQLLWCNQSDAFQGCNKTEAA